MNIEPSDIDRLVHTIVNAMVDGITRLSEVVYEWYRNRQAPYYIPSQSSKQQNYEDQPEAVYPEMPVENEEDME